MSPTEPEQFATQLIIEVLLEKYRVTKGSLESVGQIDIGGTLGVEREATQRVVTKSVGTLGIVRFHAKLAIRCLDDITRESVHNIGRFQRGVRHGASAVNSVGSCPERLSKAEGEQFVGRGATTAGAWGLGRLAALVITPGRGRNKGGRLGDQRRLRDRNRGRGVGFGDVAWGIVWGRGGGRCWRVSFDAIDDRGLASVLGFPGLDPDIAMTMNDVGNGVSDRENGEESDEN